MTPVYLEQNNTLQNDPRIVMTLDAGGTSFRFSAMRGGKSCVETIAIPSGADNLTRCLQNLVDGFRRVKAVCSELPAAISFAFPGPADYPNGIIGDLGNLPCFRGGVPLGAILSDAFGIPVFINNDGDLFTYGEAIAGFLPHVNGLLEQAGSPKCYRNLLGFTLGTGFGGGLVRNGELFLGDNSMSAEVWLLRNKLRPEMNVEESVSIRAVRRIYAELSGIAPDTSPDPKTIEAIATGREPGNRAAAIESFRRMGEAAGDAIANALTIADSLVVIGGGLSGGAPLFMPALVGELNGNYTHPDGKVIRRLVQRAFNFTAPGASELKTFLDGDVRKIEVPIFSGIHYSDTTVRPSRYVTYDPMPRFAVGVTRLGTSQAIALGACAFALQQLDKKTV